MSGSRPPLNALHVFCTVVRAGGFRQAANQLCVTPGAVSKQIEMLESRLGQKLFHLGNRNSLTADGKRLFERVADKLEAVCAALEDRSRAQRSSVLVVDTGVTFAMHWLIPKLRNFREQFPGLDVRVHTSDGPASASARADVYVRREIAELSGFESEIFMVEHSVLVCAPSFAAILKRPNRSNWAWLAHVPRIGARTRPDLWPRWVEFHDLSTSLAEPSIEFDNTVLAIQAAAQGLGVCVLPEVFIQDMLTSSTLSLLHADRVQTGNYAMALSRRRSGMVDHLSQWLREAGRTK